MIISQPLRSFAGYFAVFVAFLCFPALSAEPPPLPLPLPSAQQGQGLLPPQGFRAPDPSQLAFVIPPVFDRPLGVDEGGRVFVREFLVTGVIDDPASGVLRAEIDERVRQRFEDLNQLLSRLRLERQGQEEVGPDGFTAEERRAIVGFMADVVRDLSPDRQVEAYQGFVDQLRRQRMERTRGLTVGQLQLIADEITRYYREKGFFLARAVIPAQEVVDGVVLIRVLEGRLGGVHAQGNERYDAERIAAPFAPYVGELVTVERIEDALLTLQDYPGLDAVGMFQPGAEVGEADLLVNVTREKAFDFLVRADNFGTRFTGEHRLLGEASWNNPFGYGDQLRFTALQAFEPENSLFGALRYELPLRNPRHRIGTEMTRNTFDVANLSAADSGNEVGGISEIASLFWRGNFHRTRATRLDAELSLSRKAAETEDTGLVINRDELAVLGAELDYERINLSQASITAAFLRLDVGLDGALGVPDMDTLRAGVEPLPSRFGVDSEGNRVPAGSDFFKLGFGYSWLKSLTPSQTLMFRLNGQYSDDLLVSLEQFSIGGATSVRALPSSHYLADSGAFASLEWGMRAPGFADKPAFANRNWGDVLRVTAFYDYGWGRYVDEAVLRTGEDDSVHAGGAGLGIELGLPGLFRFNLQWARLLSGPQVQRGASADPGAVLDDDQLWLDFTIQF